MISDRMSELVEEFDNAASTWGYEIQEGTACSRPEAEAEYAATKKRLIEAIEALEAKA